MDDRDRIRWDERHADRGPVTVEAIAAPSGFVEMVEHLPRRGTVLDLACGDGRGAAWSAARGLDVLALDGSTVAVALARDLVRRAGLESRCRVELADLDGGLPPGAPVDLVTCHLFNAPALDEAVVERLAPGGLVAVAVLSEVDSSPGRFRAAPGALLDRFGGPRDLEVLHHAESDGVARLLARRTRP